MTLFARFLDGPQGALFVVGRRPPDGPHPAHWVLVVPPLFEELNRARRTLSLLGQALAAQGRGYLLPDLYGTGDSEGELSATRWDTWLADLSRTHAWLLEQGARRVDLLALRGGALLCWEWLAATTTAVPLLRLWHPFTDGRQLVAQLLRLRLAGGLMGRGGRETTATLRAQLAQEGALEIGGYRLPAALIAQLEGIVLDAPGPRRIGAVDWYQVVAATGQSLPAIAWQRARDWQDAGIRTRLRAVEEAPFWATPEIVDGSRLIAATITDLIADLTAAAPDHGRD